MTPDPKCPKCGSYDVKLIEPDKNGDWKAECLMCGHESWLDNFYQTDIDKLLKAIYESYKES